MSRSCSRFAVNVQLAKLLSSHFDYVIWRCTVQAHLKHTIADVIYIQRYPLPDSLPLICDNRSLFAVAITSFTVITSAATVSVSFPCH